MDSFQGLLIDYVHRRKANVILRGLRAISDFEYELKIASTNRILSEEVETLFLMTNHKHSFISSENVKEMAKYGADVRELVPDHVAKHYEKKFNE